MKHDTPDHRSLTVAIALIAIVSGLAPTRSDGGTETFEYDARGRLGSIKYANGIKVTYTYDAAGNRTAVTPTAASAGSFSFVSGSHTNKGSTGDVASAIIKNTGTDTITGITRSCSGGSWYPSGTPVTSLVPGASATFSCTAAASGSYTIVMTLSGSNASNSPFAPASW